jgi:lauroyl/myristoyl acyltransferase
MRPNRGAGLSVRATFAFVRRLERLLSPRGLHRFLTPLFAARAAFRHRRPSQPLPGCLGGGEFRTSKRRQRIKSLNTILEFFPEQLGTPKWRDRLQIDGLHYLETARRQKRPVILVFCHFGPYSLLRYWLRAIGFPAATVVKGQSQARSAIRRLKDRVAPFPEIPTAFHRDDQLRDAVEFVASGNVLLMAIDIMSGKKIDLGVDESWRFWMATGPIRMALRHRAELIPCTIIDQGDWRFQIRLGPPVPASSLASDDPLPAGKHLLAAMLPVWRAHPEQCTKEFLRKFHRADSENASIAETNFQRTPNAGLNREIYNLKETRHSSPSPQGRGPG